MVSVILN